MVLFLPIAVCKDWIFHSLGKSSSTKFYEDNLLIDPSVELDVPLRTSEATFDSRDMLKSCNLDDTGLNAAEEGLLTFNQDAEIPILEKAYKLSSWEIVKCSFYIAPIWFVTEVIVFFRLLASKSYLIFTHPQHS